jgi:hypothetical protein
VLSTVTPRRHTGDCGRRRASTRRPSRLCAALHLADDLEPSCPVPSSPSILILKLVRPESSRVAAVRRVGHGSPPRLDSSHPELHSLAVHPLRPPTSATVPYPGRNRAQTAVRHCCLRQAPPRASPLSSTTTFRPSFAQNESPVSFLAAYSYSPTPSPIDFGAAAAESPPRRHERAGRRPCAPPGLPAPARAPLPRALGPPGLTGAGAAPTRGHRKPPPPEHRPPPCAPPCAAVRPALRRRAPSCAALCRAPAPASPPGASARPPQRRWPAPPAGSAAAGCARPRAARARETEEVGGEPGSLASGARLSAPPPLSFMFSFNYFS